MKLSPFHLRGFALATGWALAAMAHDGRVVVSRQPPNVGEQPSDLQGDHAEKSFLLPNPFYRVP